MMGISLLPVVGSLSVNDSANLCSRGAELLGWGGNKQAD